MGKGVPLLLLQLLQLWVAPSSEVELGPQLRERGTQRGANSGAQGKFLKGFSYNSTFSDLSAGRWIAPRGLRPNPGDIPRDNTDIPGSAGRSGTPAAPKTLKPR